MKRLGLFTISAIFMTLLSGWGFFAHQNINRLAVFGLPPEMIVFYKKHIQYLTEKAVNPDKRRYVNPDEASRHYIDLDVYGDSAIYKMPRYWKDAVEEYSKDTLKAYGIVPWHINKVYYSLRDAFLRKDAEMVLRYSADLGHYVADAHVPLHTTENYNGQLTGQYGIHGFWESRLPELFLKGYDLFVGRADYIQNVQYEAWKAVESAHFALDSVLLFEQRLSIQYPAGKKYSYEEKGASVIRVYSFEYSKDYHELLNGMVERQFRRSVKMVADIWYTAWIDSGQPDFGSLLGLDILDEDMVHVEVDPSNLRNHESGEVMKD